MKGSLQVIPGIFFALLSIVIVLGSMALAMAESGGLSSVMETSISTQSNAQDLSGLIRLVSATPMPAVTEPMRVAQPEATTTTVSLPDCPPQEDWVAFRVTQEMNLLEIADANQVDAEKLRQMNCLSTNRLAPGQILYLPSGIPLETAEPTPAPSQNKPTTPKKPKKTQASCGAPRSWAIYIVRRGDTLSSLARRLNTSVAQLQSANCMGNSTIIRAGQQLFVPFIPPQMATPALARPSPTRPPAKPTQTPVLPPTQQPPTQQPPPTQPPPPPTQPPPPPTQPPPPPTQPPPPTPTDIPRPTAVPPTPTDPGGPKPTDISGKPSILQALIFFAPGAVDLRCYNSVAPT